MERHRAGRPRRADPAGPAAADRAARHGQVVSAEPPRRRARPGAPALQRQPAQLRRPRRLPAPQRHRLARIRADSRLHLARPVRLHRRDLALPPGNPEQAVLHHPRAPRPGAGARTPDLPLVRDEPARRRRRRDRICRVRSRSTPPWPTASPSSWRFPTGSGWARNRRRP